jgi:hypothetical protein
MCQVTARSLPLNSQAFQGPVIQVIHEFWDQTHLCDSRAYRPLVTGMYISRDETIMVGTLPSLNIMCGLEYQEEKT